MCLISMASIVRASIELMHNFYIQVECRLYFQKKLISQCVPIFLRYFSSSTFIADSYSFFFFSLSLAVVHIYSHCLYKMSHEIRLNHRLSKRRNQLNRKYIRLATISKVVFFSGLFTSLINAAKIINFSFFSVFFSYRTACSKFHFCNSFSMFFLTFVFSVTLWYLRRYLIIVSWRKCPDIRFKKKMSMFIVAIHSMGIRQLKYYMGFFFFFLIANC